MARGPEAKIQSRVIVYLRDRGWMVERMIGNALQKGIPDLYVFHPQFGARWIDIKNPGRYNFTNAQKQKWPIWTQHGCGIWIITNDDKEQYDKLFAAPNWLDYWKNSWGDPFNQPTKLDILKQAFLENDEST